MSNGEIPASERKTGSARRKTVVGTVTSDKMQKTIRVEVSRLERHRKYHKYIRRRTIYHVHDEAGAARAGDLVRIVETRPLSKLKRWRLVDVVKPGKRAAGEERAVVSEVGRDE